MVALIGARLGHGLRDAASGRRQSRRNIIKLTDAGRKDCYPTRRKASDEAEERVSSRPSAPPGDDFYETTLQQALLAARDDAAPRRTIEANRHFAGVKNRTVAPLLLSDSSPAPVAPRPVPGPHASRTTVPAHAPSRRPDHPRLTPRRAAPRPVRLSAPSGAADPPSALRRRRAADRPPKAPSRRRKPPSRLTPRRGEPPVPCPPSARQRRRPCRLHTAVRRRRSAEDPARS